VRAFPAELYLDGQMRTAFRGVLHPLAIRGRKLGARKGSQIMDIVSAEEMQDAEAIEMLVSEVHDESNDVPPNAVYSELNGEVVRPNFIGGAWRFAVANETFPANILDRAFLRQVHQREISFGAGDQMRVQMAVYPTSEGGNLRTQRVITKVLSKIDTGSSSISIARRPIIGIAGAQ
jgi:hypothetical protein